MSACAQDSGNRILSNDVSIHPTSNTPADCINACQANGYLYAGVEYGVECHCGTGFKSTPTNIDPSNCNIRCSGNNTYVCGGSFAIQLYKGTAPVETFPTGWETFMSCAVDNGQRVIYHDSITQLSNNTPATCAAFCNAAGYTIAGVEYGKECHCGNTFKAGNGPVAAPDIECNKPCTGNSLLECGGSFRIQLYTLTS